VQGSPAGLLGLRGGFRKVIIEDEEILLGGDIILQVDQIKISGEDSYFRIADHLDSAKSTTTHKIKVLRAGEILEFDWTSTEN
jgi:S1-C subfamily serine protease